MTKEKKYYLKLDYIRAIACFLVLFYHLNIIKGGFLAVCTFFVLTGYLKTIKALDDKNFSLKKYYVNRFKKIYLPLLLVVFLTLIIYNAFYDTNWLNIKKETISVIFGYNNFWQLSVSMNYFTKHISSPFIHLWYISILIQFDLIFPLVFKLFKKIDQKTNKHTSTIIVLLLTIASLIYFFVLSKKTNIMPMYYNTFARLYAILTGVLLALIHHKYNFKISRLFKPINNLIFMIYSFILIILCFVISIKTNNVALYMFLVTLLSTRLIEYALTDDKIKTNFDRSIYFMSKNSYEIYLVQYPLIYFSEQYKINSNIKAIIVIILTILIAWLLHYIIYKKHKKNYKQFLKNLCLLIIIIYGSFVLYNQKDNSAEMKELENKLEDNAKIKDKKKEEYLNHDVEEIEEKVDVEQIVTNLPVVGIGDSVLLGAADGLYQKFPNGYFDGKVSRTIRGGEQVMIDLQNQGRLSDILILALANNGDYSDRINTELMNLVGDRQVYWVTAVLADDPEFNNRFKEFAKNYPNIHIVEWEETSKNHPEYFYADGIHLKKEGMNAYAEIIYNTILADYQKQYQNKKNNK